MAEKKASKSRKKSEPKSLVDTLAQKDAQFKRDQGKAGEGEGWHVTDEKLRDGLRFVDMDKHAIKMKK